MSSMMRQLLLGGSRRRLLKAAPAHCRGSTTSVVVAACTPLSNGRAQDSNAVGMFALAGTLLAAGMATTQCQEAQQTDNLATTGLMSVQLKQEDMINEDKAPPAVMLGPREKDIDALVTELLKDPTINMSMIPDVVERQIYKSTIQLTLHAIYSALNQLQGTRMLAHQIEISKAESSSESSSDLSTLLKSTRSINDQLLEDVATRMMSNKAINSSLLPDAIEKQVYVNCIQIIFRVLTIVLDSLRLEFCGHTLQITLQQSEGTASSAADRIEASIAKSSSKLSQVDLEALRKFALDSGVDEGRPAGMSGFSALFITKRFVAKLHASLYGLVLGILDDLLAHSQIHLLGESIVLDLVVADAEDPSSAGSGTTTAGDDSNVVSFAAASFAAGMGVGVAIMALLTQQS